MCQIETIFDIVSKNLLTLFDNPAHLISLFFYISRFGSFWYSRGQRQQDYAAQRGPQRRRKQTHAIRRASASSGCSFGGDFAVSAKPHCVRRREGPCFGVWAAVCDSLSRAGCVPTFACEANVGHLCEKLKNGMKSGLGQSCSGNFLTIFAGTVLGEKSNFTGRFFERWGPFDKSTR